MCSVGIQKCTGQIHDILASPIKHQSWIFCYNRHLSSFQILFAGISHEFIYIFWIYDNCHTLLRFGNCNLSTIKSCVFLRHLVQINLQTICKFTDCYRHATCSKVITFFNQTADFFSTEQSLNLTLCRCITFLYLSTAGLDRLFCVYLRRTGSSTTAVTPGTSTKKNDDISRI